MSNADYIGGVGAADQVVYTQGIEPDKTEHTKTGEEQFAQVLSNTVNEYTANMLTNAVNSGLTPNQAPGMTDYLPMLGITNPAMSSSVYGMGLPVPAMDSTIEQAIQSASSSGDKNDAMMALLMMMMMMQSGESGGGEMPMLMQLMAAMIGQMQEKQTIYNDFVKTPDISPNVLDTVDTQVFQSPETQEGGLSGSYLPLQWWKPAVTRTVSDEYDRSPQRYRTVLDELEVETAERYRPGREGHTYCNVYVWDATRAMGAEIPYYTNPANGAPREYPDIQGASYNGAMAMDRWLKTYGGQYGWRQVSAEEAQMHANTGRPAVASGADIGHISMIAPSENGSFDPVKGVVVAQAGRTVTNYMHISGIYGAMALRDKVTYWVHD